MASIVETIDRIESKFDSVNHPQHYTNGQYECIKVMEDVFGKEATQDFCILNAFKYVWRHKNKNGKEDIEKAVFYLNKFLELDEKEDTEL